MQRAAVSAYWYEAPDILNVALDSSCYDAYEDRSSQNLHDVRIIRVSRVFSTVCKLDLW